MPDAKALEEAMVVDTVDAKGYHIGAHVIPAGPHGNPEMYVRQFRDDQRALGGTPQQLEVLSAVRAGHYDMHAGAADAQTRAVLAAVPDATYGTMAGRSEHLRSRERTPEHAAAPVVEKDQATVLVNGVERAHGGVTLSGTLSGIERSDGQTTLQYAVGGRLQTVTFSDPTGKDAAGHDTRHPLSGLNDLGAGDKFKLSIDASGKNAAYSVETDNGLKYDVRVGPQATKIFGEPAKQVEPKHGSPELEAAMAVDTVDERGYHVGAHVIPRGPYKQSELYLDQFKEQQRALGGTPEQLAVLADVRAGKRIDSQDPKTRAVLAAVPDGEYATLAAREDAIREAKTAPHGAHAEAAQPDRDQATVRVNGVEKERGGVTLAGKVSGVEHDSGTTTVQYPLRGRLQTISFEDPIGKDQGGNPIAHPLHGLSTLQEGDQFNLKIDRSGKNVAYSVETTNDLRYDVRHGAQAEKIYGPPAQEREAIHHAR